MKTTQSLKQAHKATFNRELKFLQKNVPKTYDGTLYDLPLMNMVNRVKGIRKDFKSIAFIGPNPDLFLRHLPKELQVEEFYFVEQTEQQVKQSYDRITKLVAAMPNMPDRVEPVVLDDERWLDRFGENQFDLIVNIMQMHWVNELEATLRAFNASLKPDGVLMASMLGGDTLQELRICMNLAELERDGGVSPVVSPMLSLTEMGNTFARC